MKKSMVCPFGKNWRKEIWGADADTEIQEILKQQIEKATYHFGDPHLNVATIAGIYRMTLKEYDARHGFKTERKIKPYVKMTDFL